MRALTAKGSLSEWQDSVRITMQQLGFMEQPSRSSSVIIGKHEQYGLIQVRFFVPDVGKIRLEISNQDEAFYEIFKKELGSVYRKVATERVENSIQTDKDCSEIESFSEEEDISSQNDDNDSESVKEDQGESAENDFTDENFDEKELTEPISKKVCKKCGSEMDKKEKTCPECGAKQDKKGMIIGIVIGVFVLLIVGVFACLKFAGEDDAGTPTTTTTSQPSETTPTVTPQTSDGTQTLEQPDQGYDVELPVQEGVVTSDQFSQLQEGMTYEDVCALFGEEGVLIQEVTIKNENNEDVQYAGYFWTGKGKESSFVTIYFENGVLDVKSQYGLQ